MFEGDNKDGDGRKKNAPISLQFDTLESTFDSLADAGVKFNQNEISERRMKAWVHYFGALLKYWRLRKDLRVEEDIAELRKLLEERGEIQSNR